MKYLALLILLMITFISSCDKPDFETGIKGTVEYGSGDCMPIIDYESREYSNYNGKLFFIVKDELVSLAYENFDDLKKNSLSCNITNGDLQKELPPGTYVLMPDDLYENSDNNTVTIELGEICHKDFQFWRCTSY